MATQSVYDVLIIGSGPGGLATATALARQLYTAVVFNSGVFRNARADHMHNFLGWDHQSPEALRQKARRDLSQRYETVTFQDDTVISNIERLDNGHFLARSNTGKQSWEGKSVVLAHGITDIPPNIPGYDECWGRGVFHCLFCHGYEERGTPHVGVLATGELASAPFAVHVARMAKRLAKSVTIYTHGSQVLADEISSASKGVAGVSVDTRQISSLKQSSSGPEVTMRFVDGTEVVCGFVANKPASKLNGDFATQLGLELAESGRYKVSAPFQETSVKRVFAVGDCSTPMEAVAIAASGGAAAGAGVAFSLAGASS